MRRGLLAVLLASGVLGCSAGESDHPAAPSEARQPRASETDEMASESDPCSNQLRVLVTGFHDWRELGEPPAIWRCRDNPSCRLLLGEQTLEQPRDYAGPLVARLERAAPDIDWRFRTMPVTWNAFAEVPTDVDVIINIGLGVYDRFDALQLEAGAYNLRAGKDASGAELVGPIAGDRAEVLEPPASSPVAARLARLAGQRVAGYEIVIARARPDNSYLCNETHFFALSALHRGEAAEQGSAQRLGAVYFLHIPYAREGDYEALADGVAAVVLALTG